MRSTTWATRPTDEDHRLTTFELFFDPVYVFAARGDQGLLHQLAITWIPTLIGTEWSRVATMSTRWMIWLLGLGLVSCAPSEPRWIEGGLYSTPAD